MHDGSVADAFACGFHSADCHAYRVELALNSSHTSVISAEEGDIRNCRWRKSGSLQLATNFIHIVHAGTLVSRIVTFSARLSVSSIFQ